MQYANREIACCNLVINHISYISRSQLKFQGLNINIVNKCVFFISAWKFLKYEALRHTLQTENSKMKRPKVTVLTALIDDNFYYNKLIFAI